MKRKLGLALWAAALSISTTVSAQQQLTSDQEKRIKIGVDLIKLGCGTGSNQERTQVSGNADVSLTLRKPPGVSAGGQVVYSTDEAQGLAASLQKELTAEGKELSLVQINCMRPYVDRIFALIFPNQSQSQDGRLKSDQVSPVTMSLASARALAGYSLKEPAALPVGLESGPLLPGGGRVRLVLQADSQRVVQIDRISVVVRWRSPTTDLAMNYVFDQSKQSGFGAARSREYNVVMNGSSPPKVTYINDRNEPLSVSSENILPKNIFLELDLHSGLQEALDINLVPGRPGFYEVRFVGFAAAMGEHYEISAGPVYLIRH